MADDKIVEPIRDINLLKIGDFVEWKFPDPDESRLTAALVVGTEKKEEEIIGRRSGNKTVVHYVTLVHFEYGYPFEFSIDLSSGSIRRVLPKEEAHGYIAQASNSIKAKTKQSRLEAALSATYAHSLDLRIANMQQSDDLLALTAKKENYGTGVYVIRGLYSNLQPDVYEKDPRVITKGKSLELVVTNPTTTSTEVEIELKKRYPPGIGSISGIILDKFPGPTREIPLIGYRAVEICKEALSLVNLEDAIKLSSTQS